MFLFFFNDTATTEIYTLSLHDALPICDQPPEQVRLRLHHARTRLDALDDQRAHHQRHHRVGRDAERQQRDEGRSEEHTSELQSRQYLVCRLLLEKKKTTYLSSTT